MLYYYWKLKRRIGNRKIHTILMNAIRSQKATTNSEGCLVVKSDKTLSTSGFLVNSETGELIFEIPSEAAFDNKGLQGIALRVIYDTSRLQNTHLYSYEIVKITKSEYLEIKKYLLPFFYKTR